MKKAKIVSLILIILLHFNLLSQVRDYQTFQNIYKNKVLGVGVVDMSTGDTVFQVSGFGVGLFADNYGYVVDSAQQFKIFDNQFKWVTETTFSEISLLGFQENKLPVKTSSGKWTYLKKDGSLLFNTQFEIVFGFNEGMAVVGNSDVKAYRAVIKTSSGLTDTLILSADNPKLKKAIYKELDDRFRFTRYSYINDRGELVNKNLWLEEAYEFANGVAYIKRPGEDYFELVNKKLKKQFKTNFTHVSPFSRIQYIEINPSLGIVFDHLYHKFPKLYWVTVNSPNDSGNALATTAGKLLTPTGYVSVMEYEIFNDENAEESYDLKIYKEIRLPTFNLASEYYFIKGCFPKKYNISIGGCDSCAVHMVVDAEGNVLVTGSDSVMWWFGDNHELKHRYKEINVKFYKISQLEEAKLQVALLASLGFENACMPSNCNVELYGLENNDSLLPEYYVFSYEKESHYRGLANKQGMILLPEKYATKEAVLWYTEEMDEVFVDVFNPPCLRNFDFENKKYLIFNFNTEKNIPDSLQKERSILLDSNGRLLLPDGYYFIDLTTDFILGQNIYGHKMLFDLSGLPLTQSFMIDFIFPDSAKFLFYKDLNTSKWGIANLEYRILHEAFILPSINPQVAAFNEFWDLNTVGTSPYCSRINNNLFLVYYAQTPNPNGDFQLNHVVFLDSNGNIVKNFFEGGSVSVFGDICLFYKSGYAIPLVFEIPSFKEHILDIEYVSFLYNQFGGYEVYNSSPASRYDSYLIVKKKEEDFWGVWSPKSNFILPMRYYDEMESGVVNGKTVKKTIKKVQPKLLYDSVLEKYYLIAIDSEQPDKGKQRIYF